MTDDRIHQYLTDRASTIELRPADPAAITQRVARRRRVRRSLAVATVAVVLGASAVLITSPGDEPDDVVSHASSVTASPLDWSLVEPSTGLGSNRSSALTDDGALYSLSTAPGVPESDADWLGHPATLYRSVDGAEWTPVELPGDFWASSLAGAGNRLYAVGTAPAGGGSAYRVASSDDGGATWSTVEVPAALTELQERYPDEIEASPPSIAVHDGTVVVSASVAGMLDVEARLPDGVALPNAGWETTEDGVTFLSDECMVAEVERDATAAPELPADPACFSPTTVTLADPASSDPGNSDPGDSEEQQSYTWADLGVDDELRDLIVNGRDFLFVSRDGGEFAPADLGDVASTGGQVVAADDGFTLFLRNGTGAYGTTTVLKSADGTAWEPAGELSGYLSSAGTVGGRPAAATSGQEGTAVNLAQADGSWLAIDPLTALDGQPQQASTGQVAFGPLGWAATVWEDAADGADGAAGSTAVVHSVDGTSLSVVPLDDVLDVPPYATLDVSVTADAVIVRVTNPDGDLTTISPQSVVVGTPRD